MTESTTETARTSSASAEVAGGGEGAFALPAERAWFVAVSIGMGLGVVFWTVVVAAVARTIEPELSWVEALGIGGLPGLFGGVFAGGVAGAMAHALRHPEEH